MKARLTRPEAGNIYYNTPDAGGVAVGIIKGSPTDKGCNVLANCVGYAAGRFNEIIGAGKFVYYQYAPNAECFYKFAGQYGLATGAEPRAGAIAVWSKGSPDNPNDGAGHVAIVEQINSDGSIITSESGYGCASPFWTTHREKGGGNWGAGSDYKFLGFVYQPEAPTSRDLKKGMFGYDVRKMQTALSEKGYLRRTEIDGDFGTITLGGVCAFQLESGLVVDGICGEKTRAALGI